MNDTALQIIEQVEAFPTVAQAVEFRFETTAAGYAWVQSTLVRFAYTTLGKAHKRGRAPLSAGGDGVLPGPSGLPDPNVPADRAA